MRAALATAFVALFVLPAAAGRYIMQRGETLEHVAKAHGCSTDALMRANGVDTTLIKAGTVIQIPACNVRARAQVRAHRAAPRPDDRARRALAVIDGTSVVDEPEADVAGERLPSGDGYRIRRPHRAFGEPHVIEHLRGTIATVRALYPGVHTLAIGDLSARGGGKIADHLSHRSGLDVDLGFFFHEVPEGYPDRFVAANDQLDLEATWALLTGFARTSHLPDGVSMIFLDEGIQERLHRWARKRGVPDEQLAQILQYPRPRDSHAGLVRHWPNHADHMHVRFRSK